MSNESVHVINYGLGNLGSIMNMFRRIGVSAKLTDSPDEIERAERILLPGVGAFDAGMKLLHEKGLVEPLTKAAMVRKIPVLGICLGMQLMSNGSEEGVERGLGWIPSQVVDMRRLTDGTRNLKFPHVGWNYINPQYEHFLFSEFPEDPRFYFVHGYMVRCERKEHVLATTQYGDIDVTAMVMAGNIIGAQGHPEKSHKFGMKLLKNFSIWMPSL